MEFGVCLLRRCTLHSLLALPFLMLINLSVAQSTERSMNCYAQVNVSLNSSGSVLLTLDMLTGMSNLDSMVLEIPGQNAPIVDCSAAGQKIKFIVRDTTSNLSCWGYLLVEDKIPFEILCNDGAITCIDGLDSLNPGDFITIDDNCLTLADLTVTTVNTSPISFYPSGSDTIGVVVRTWQVTGDDGYSQVCNSLVYLLPLSLDSIILPPDTTIYCGQDPSDMDITGRPNYSEDRLLQYCNIALMTSLDTIGSFNCGSKQKYVRTWALSDWVTGALRIEKQYIIVEDTTIATIVAPSSPHVFYDGCDPMLIIEPPVQIINNCTDVSNADIQVIIDDLIGFYQIGDTVATSIGMHRLIYTAYNACIDYLRPDTLSFNIAAPSAPMLTCDSTLNRAISIKDQDSIRVLIDSAFASAQVTSCIPFRLLARKMNPVCLTDVDTFRAYLDFCLDEVCDKVLIQLIAQDSMGRYSDTCEVWIDIQEKVPPSLTLQSSPTIDIGSDGTVTLDSFVILAAFGDNSNGPLNISMTGSGLGMTGSGVPMWALSGSMSDLFSDGTFYTFTCQDTGMYLVTVEIADCSNNITIDTTTLTVRANGNCPSAAPVFTGVVNAYGMDPMEDVIVTSKNGEIALVSITDVNGYFTFDSVQAPVVYDLDVYYPDDWQSGLSANDLALLEEYIIGIRDLDTYQLTSADVDDSKTINLIDLLLMRKLILGQELDLGELEPWVFSLDDGNSDSEIQLSGTFLKEGNIAISGMKRGDLDADAMTGASTRSADQIDISRIVSNQDVSTYHISLGNPQKLRALQLSLQVSGNTEVVSIESHQDMDYTISDENIDLLYYKSTSEDPLWMEVTLSGESNNVPFILNQRIKPLQWTQDGSMHALRLSYNSILDIEENPILLAVYPNPTNDNISISLKYRVSDKTRAGIITLSDALGRRVYQEDVTLAQHTVFRELTVPVPDAKGIYIVTFWVGQEQRQIKIVKN